MRLARHSFLFVFTLGILLTMQKLSKKDTERLSRIFSRTHNLTEKDRQDITTAYLFAKKAHRGQKRFSGRAYLVHPAAVTALLAELGSDANTLIAGLLHDTIEDTSVTANDILEHFNEEVLFLVDGVSKLGKLKYHGLKRHVESLRKLFIAMAQDPRVVIIKLADRLHNLQTLNHIKDPEKQSRIAIESLEIYAPIAHRLGIGKLKGSIEDHAFQYAYPKEYALTQKLIKTETRKNKQLLEKITRKILTQLAEKGVRVVKVDHRVKHLYSMWKKLKHYNMSVEKIYDIAALRIQVPRVEDCYTALGIVHESWKPVPGRIKDYIATPKPNGYQSLHTTVFTGNDRMIEVQIRTPEMHHDAEYGMASHVLYKEDGGSSSSFDFVRRLFGMKNEANAEKKHVEAVEWLKELARGQKDIESPQTFIKNLKTDFFNDRIFVFTPKGEVVDLPTGATSIDFAYAIHSSLGDHLHGVKINGKYSSLDQELKNGDMIFIETSKKKTPTKKWLEHAKTTSARQKIRAIVRGK
jgi:GTP pyrophosphokinase